MLPGLIITSLLLLAAIAVCAWLLAERRGLIAERDRLRGELQTADAQNESLRKELHELETAIQVAGARHKHLEETYKNLQGEMENRFKALAGDVLKGSNEEFLKLAKATLQSENKDADKQLEVRKKEIEGLVTPIRETLEKYNKALDEVEKSRKTDYGSLGNQVKTLIDDQQKLRVETGRLVKALHRSEVRGRWGEVQLRRVAELAGMIPYCDFYEQTTQATADGLNRPDMIVRLPSERTIVIDAKTPIDAYLDSLDCDDEQLRRSLAERHADNIEMQVKSLSAKQYWSQFERSPDFVVLFIPGESFLYAAVAIRPELIERAMEKQVLIATPITLIALLKVIAQGWREERIAEHAEQINELGKEMHGRLVTAIEHLQGVGKSLEGAVKNYNNFIGSLERQVMPSARRFEELGTQSNKKLPESVDQLEIVIREPKLPAKT